MKWFGILLVALGTAHAAPLKVASLHPLIGDLLRQVGGDAVEVVDLIGETGDPHSFEPQAEDLATAKGAEIYFVSGMGPENYLPELKAVLAGKTRIVEVGATLPALHGACDHEGHDHDHEHELDPHWWHSVDLFRRATSVVADELSKQRPEHAETFARNAAAYRGKRDGQRAGEFGRVIRQERAATDEVHDDQQRGAGQPRRVCLPLEPVEGARVGG